MKKSEVNKGAFIGIWSGIIAALCCLGPLIIILFGLGTVSFALSVSEYKPFFLGAGILFIIGAIILYLRKKNKTCDINCFSLEGIKREKHFILSIILSMGITYVFLLYVVAPKISPIIYGSLSQEIGTSFQAKNTLTRVNPDKNLNLRILTLKIEGMTCESCAQGIEWYLLNQLDGVKEAKINYSQGKGEIIYNPEKITKEKLLNSEIFKTYKASVLSDQSLKEKK